MRERDENMEEMCGFVKVGVEICLINFYILIGYLILLVNKYVN